MPTYTLHCYYPLRCTTLWLGLWRLL